MWPKDKRISETELHDKITIKTVKFAEEFGTYLAKADSDDLKGARVLTTSQLRKFFGDVKRQQLTGYNATSFAMLKPKLAYAVGRAKAKAKAQGKLKIEDFRDVLVDAIDKVEKASDKKQAFNNFITAFEAIVAYHKAAAKD